MTHEECIIEAADKLYRSCLDLLMSGIIYDEHEAMLDRRPAADAWRRTIHEYNAEAWRRTIHEYKQVRAKMEPTDHA